MKTEQIEQQVERHEAAVEPYMAPSIEVIDIKLQQNILSGSGDSDENILDIPGEGA